MQTTSTVDPHFWDIALLVMLTLIPFLIGLFWMLPDANRKGKRGWIWALATVPFGWLTVLVYMFNRFDHAA